MAGIRDMVDQVMMSMGIEDEQLAKMATKASEPQVAQVLKSVQETGQAPTVTLPQPDGGQSSISAQGIDQALAMMQGSTPFAQADKAQVTGNPFGASEEKKKLANPFQYRTPFTVPQ